MYAFCVRCVVLLVVSGSALVCVCVFCVAVRARFVFAGVLYVRVLFLCVWVYVLRLATPETRKAGKQEPASIGPTFFLSYNFDFGIDAIFLLFVVPCNCMLHVQPDAQCL